MGPTRNGKKRAWESSSTTVPQIKVCEDESAVPKRRNVPLWQLEKQQQEQQEQEQLQQQLQQQQHPSTSSSSSSSSSSPASRRAAWGEPNLEQELKRAAGVQRLRDVYERWCKETLFLEKAPSDSLDRWLLEQLAHSSRPEAADPMMPNPQVAVTSKVLIRELVASVPYRVPRNAYGPKAYDAITKYLDTAEKWLQRAKELVSAAAAAPSATSGAAAAAAAAATTTTTTSPPSSSSSSAASLLAAASEPIAAIRAWTTENSKLASWRPKKNKDGTMDCAAGKKLEELAPLSKNLFQPFADPFAIDLAKQLADEAQRMVQDVRGTSSASSSSPAKPKADDVSIFQDEKISSEGVSIKFVCIKYLDDVLRLSPIHFRKLRALYCRSLGVSEDALAADEELERDFSRRLYVMLRRYVTFIGMEDGDQGTVGGNMHAAAPESVFNFLAKDFKVNCEGFASPLNCYFSSFYSAFPDVDRPFGSLGSFFDSSLLEGSFEVGPPYTEEVLELMSVKLLEFLQASDRPLSFFVFVPDWPGAGGLNLMDGPGFQGYRRNFGEDTFVLAKGREHHYITGVQFFAEAGQHAEKRYYTVPHGTRVYVLQNDAGAKRWPFSEEQQEQLLEHLKPPKAEA